jgi:hypothetical protein
VILISTHAEQDYADVGPNLTYFGSLATLLWRQALHARGHPADAREFLRLGPLTVSACLPVGVAALWLSLAVGIILSRPRGHHPVDLLLAGMHPRGGPGTLVG